MVNKPNNVILCKTENQAQDVEFLLKIQQKDSSFKLTPIKVLDQWLAEKYQDYCMVNSIEKVYKILNGIEEKFLWEEIIRNHLLKNGDDFLSEINIDDICKMTISANRLVTEHLITDEELSKNVAYKEARYFNEWRYTFNKVCEDQKKITKYSFIKQCIKIIKSFEFVVNEDLYIVGLDEKIPLFESLIDSLSKTNNIMKHESSLIKKANVIERQYHSYDDEIDGIINWIINNHQKNQYQLLVITPALDYFQNKIQNAIDRKIQPKIFDSLNTDNITRSSLRRPLSIEPIIRAAFELIKINEDKPIAIKVLCELLLFSNWIDIEGFEDRQKFCDYLYKLNRPKLSIKSIIQIIMNDPNISHLDLSKLTKVLNINFKNQKKWKEHKKVKEWAWLIEDYLKSINFSIVNSLLNIEINNINSFYDVLNEFNISPINEDKMEFGEYLNRLFYYLENFVSKQPDGQTTIDLYGYHEHPIKNYDAIWLSNMNEKFWPGRIEFNPFLSKTLQKKYHIFDEIYIDQINESSRLRLESISNELIISCSLQENDSILRISPSIKNATYIKKDKQNKKDALFLIQELIDDSYANPINGEIYIKGGRICLEKQKSCPAWAFYEHRLGTLTYNADKQDILTKRAEGELIHKILEMFWTKHRNSKVLIQMSNEKLIDEINGFIDTAIDQFIEKHQDINPLFVDYEKKYLEEIVLKWLSYEKIRPPFTVLECEKSYEIKVNRIKFTVKIDRIDALENESKLLIDYKTGNTPFSRRSLFSINNRDLQLPIYAAFSGIESLGGVSIGWINRKNVNLYGITSDPNTIITSNLNGRIDSSDINCWQDLINYWIFDLEEVAKDYLSGNASVTFNEDEVFDYCEALPLLRLAEKKYQFENYE